MAAGESSSRRSLTALVMKEALAVGELPPKKKNKPERVVLEEEEYLDQLGTIIQRDFFPDIPKLKAQNEYLEALDRNDVAKIREMQLKFSSRRTEPRANSPTLRRSPSTFETPDVAQGPEASDASTRNPEAPAGADNEGAKVPVKLDGVGLDRYLRKYNSEDNAAFDELQVLDDRRHKIKHAWMFKAEIDHNRRRICQGPHAEGLPQADEQAAITYARPKELDNWSYKAQNSVLFKPQEVELSEAELIERAKLEPPKIQHGNTRFSAAPFSEAVRKERMAKAGILQAALNKGKYDAQGREESGPIGAGLGPVATPSPMPGVNESPMMTWGEIEGTPFRLDAGDTHVPSTPGPTFKMPDVPLRDRLAQSMTEQIAIRHRRKKEKALLETKSIGLRTGALSGRRNSSMERIASMSPAARRLASNKLGIRLGTDETLKASYTPSPVRRKSGTPLVSPSPKGKRETPSPAPASSITDGLLNLPSSSQRPGASDFF